MRINAQQSIPIGLPRRGAEVRVEPRIHRYQELANQVRARVKAGEFGRGTLLPSEANLAKAYGVSRLTVKRSLDLLRREHMIEARRGFGWFVPGAVLKHSLPELGTIEQQTAKSGAEPMRQVLEFAFAEADDYVSSVLQCDVVLRTVRLNFANNEPVAKVTTWCPEQLGADLSRTDVEKRSLYDLLPVEIGRATQTIRAVAVTKGDAQLLGVPVGSPCLASERVTYALDGRPVLYAVAVFAGHLTEYVVELEKVGHSSDPSVRLASTILDAAPAS